MDCASTVLYYQCFIYPQYNFFFVWLLGINHDLFFGRDFLPERVVFFILGFYEGSNLPFHHHHVPEGLGMLSCSLILKMKLVPPSLPRSSYVSSSFVRFFLLRILRVSWCPPDRLPARRRMSLVVGLPPWCLKAGMLFCSWMGPVVRRWTFAFTLSRLLQF